MSYATLISGREATVSVIIPVVSILASIEDRAWYSHWEEVAVVIKF